MKEIILLLNLRAWGCKIKSNINARLELDNENYKQGEQLDAKLVLSCDPEDIPKTIELSQEEKSGLGFKLDKPIKEEVSDPEFTLDIPLKYSGGSIGSYRLEVGMKHAEYGTELGIVPPVNFMVMAPDVAIEFCNVTTEKLTHGQEFHVRAGLNSPAPQKLRGIVYGRLTSNDNLDYKLYELEPKRVSILGEKEVSWTLNIHNDESKMGKFNAIIEFKSKDSFSKKTFEGLLEVRQPRALRMNSLVLSNTKLSPGDELVLDANIENTGLEDVKFEARIRVVGSSGKAEYAQVGLEPKQLDLTQDAKTSVNWIWPIPDEFKIGRYSIVVTCRDEDNRVINTTPSEQFEITKYHDIKILDAISTGGSFRAGAKADVKLVLSDNGSRVGDMLKIDWRVLDILGQEVYRNTKSMEINQPQTEVQLIWDVPSELDGGMYNLVVRILAGENVLVKQKYQKIFNIELPVKLEVHQMLPHVAKIDAQTSLGAYLLENEEVIKKIKHRRLSIYSLNSNTHLFILDDKLITYSPDKRSSASELQAFGEALFSYLISKHQFMDKYFKQELDHWSKIAHCWLNQIYNGQKLLRLTQKKGDAGNQIKKPSFDSIDKLSAVIFQNLGGSSDSKGVTKKFKAGDMFQQAILKNAQITGNDDFRSIMAIMEYLVGYLSPGPNQVEAISDKPAKIDKGANSKNELKIINQINDIFQTAIKFRRKPNSKLLQNKFSRTSAKLLSNVRKSRVNRKPNKILNSALRAGYSYLLLYLVFKITKLLKGFKKERYIPLSKFRNLTFLQFLYYFVLMKYYRAEARYDPYYTLAIEDKDINKEPNRAYAELRSVNAVFWSYQLRWQILCANYLQNMQKRGNLAFIHEHITLTSNPLFMHGLRGKVSRDKIIFGNNGARTIMLQPYLALPTMHWTLLEPEANLSSNVYRLKRFAIAPKQTKEIHVVIQFPRSLTFNEYTGILKLTPQRFELLRENI